MKAQYKIKVELVVDCNSDTNEYEDKILLDGIIHSTLHSKIFLNSNQAMDVDNSSIDIIRIE